MAQNQVGEAGVGAGGGLRSLEAGRGYEEEVKAERR